MNKAYKTVMEMLNDRGYLVTKRDLDDMDPVQFEEQYGDTFSFDFRTTKRGDDTNQILVSFVHMLSTKTVRDTRIQMEREGVHTVIFVVQNHVSPIAVIESKFSVKVHFEIFKKDELLFNPRRHTMVPEHRLLTGDEKTALLNKYGLKVTELPRIQVADPIARYYGVKPGQVMKITRRSESAGKYITYRVAA